jgi:MATE family multidrug resistance protein
MITVSLLAVTNVLRGVFLGCIIAFGI